MSLGMQGLLIPLLPLNGAVPCTEYYGLIRNLTLESKDISFPQSCWWSGWEPWPLYLVALIPFISSSVKQCSVIRTEL